ncbi:MAG: hypothetical protein KBD78_02645 [Oligoflexales bacterium]|nr:hypothetical protein [Oligoflexales bacterium]
MSKRTVDLSELMAQASKRQKVEYDILDHGSRIVSAKEEKQNGLSETKVATPPKTKQPKSVEAKNLPAFNELQTSALSEVEKSASAETVQSSSNSSGTFTAPSVRKGANSFEKAPVKSTINRSSDSLSLETQDSLHLDASLSFFILSLIKESFNARELKVALAILVETNCGGDSLTSLSLEKISEVSGVYKNHVSGVLKKLVAKRIVKKERADNGTSNRYAVILKSTDNQQNL